MQSICIFVSVFGYAYKINYFSCQSFFSFFIDIFLFCGIVQKNKKENSMRTATEAQIQRGVLDYLELLSRKKPIYYFRSAAGMVKTDQGRVFKTGKPGTPDITVCCGGLFIGLEIKTTTGRQSALQKKAQAEIEAAGGKYYIIRCLEDVWKILS